MRALGIRIRDREREPMSFLLALIIKDSGRMMRKMVKESFIGGTVLRTMVNG